MAASVVQSDDFLKETSHSRSPSPEKLLSKEKIGNVEKQNIDLSVKCRGCFVEEPEMHFLYTIFDQSMSLADILIETAGFKCEKDDGLPPYLCSKCTSALIDFFNFKIHFKQTEEYMQTVLSQIDEKHETCSTPDDPEDTLEILPPKLLSLHDFPDENNRECTTCFILFADPEEYVTHNAEKHGINPFERYGKFRECVLKQEKTMTEARRIRRAIDYHRREEDSKSGPGKWCRICRLKFPDEEFDEHWQTHKTHVCDVCGLKFTKKFHMLQHIKTVHASDRVYQCEVCQKKFKTNTCKKRHMILHNNPRAFCCEVCGQRFNSMNTLRVHIQLRHVGSRDFICHICNMAFPLKNTLDKHIIRHNLNRVPEFECNVCKAAFKDRSSLKRHHFIKHTDQFVRPQCEVCLKTYCSTSKLKVHIERHHSGVAYERKKKGPKSRPLFVFEDVVGEVEIGYSSEEEKKVYKQEPGGSEDDLFEEKPGLLGDQSGTSQNEVIQLAKKQRSENYDRGNVGANESSGSSGHLSSFVVRTGQDKKKELDRQIAKAVYATNCSFRSIEN